jgi:hypothetical protein
MQFMNWLVDLNMEKLTDAITREDNFMISIAFGWGKPTRTLVP